MELWQLLWLRVGECRKLERRYLQCQMVGYVKENECVDERECQGSQDEEKELQIDRSWCLV